MRDQALSIPLGRSIKRPNLLVHQRLGKAGLINLVVTVVAIPDHVDKGVFFELLPVAYQKSAGFDDSFGIRSVDAQDGDTERFDDIS